MKIAVMAEVTSGAAERGCGRRQGGHEVVEIGREGGDVSGVEAALLARRTP